MNNNAFMTTGSQAKVPSPAVAVIVVPPDTFGHPASFADEDFDCRYQRKSRMPGAITTG